MEAPPSSSSNSATLKTLPEEWNPTLNMENRNPSREALRRIRTDLKNVIKDNLPGIYCIPDERYATVCHALIVGPFDTPYECGYFYFLIDCPDDYPHNPPKVMLMNTGGGTVRFNPNLYANGKVCLSILGTWVGPSWSPIHTLSSVLISIQSLMNSHPYHNEPGFEIERRAGDSANYNACIRHETIRVAVISMLGESGVSHSMPASLTQVVRSLFLSFMESYEITCQENTHLDGQSMLDPFGINRGKFCYGDMLTRLREIYSRLLEEEGHENTDKKMESPA